MPALKLNRRKMAGVSASDEQLVIVLFAGIFLNDLICIRDSLLSRAPFINMD